MLPGIRGFLAAVGGPDSIISVTVTHDTGSVSGGIGFFFTGSSIGSPPTGTQRRYVFVIAAAEAGNSRDLDFIQFNSLGVTPDKKQVNTSPDGVVEFIAHKEFTNSDTTVDLEIQYTGNVHCHAFVVSVITTSAGLTIGPTSSDTASPVSMSLDVPANGYILAGASGRDTGTFSWSELPNNTQTEFDSGDDYHSMNYKKYLSPVTGQTFAATASSPNAEAGVAIVLEPV